MDSSALRVYGDAAKVRGWRAVDRNDDFERRRLILSGQGFKGRP